MRLNALLLRLNFLACPRFFQEGLHPLLGTFNSRFSVELVQFHARLPVTMTINVLQVLPDEGQSFFRVCCQSAAEVENLIRISLHHPEQDSQFLLAQHALSDASYLSGSVPSKRKPFLLLLSANPIDNLYKMTAWPASSASTRGDLIRLLTLSLLSSLGRRGSLPSLLLPFLFGRRESQPSPEEEESPPLSPGGGASVNPRPPNLS